MNLSFIQVFFEDFHAIPSLINLENEHGIEGTTAYKFATLTRLGRSFGIFFNAASQRATAKECPKALMPGFSHRFSFHHYNPQDHEALNLPLGNEIKAAERGRCAYEKGFLQFPYLNDEDIKSLLKTHLKEFHSNFLFKTVDEVKSSLG